MAKREMATVVLGERDLEILEALEKWGVLGLAQLDGLAFKKQAPEQERIRLLFNETDRKMYTLAAYKRLRDLELAGYIKGHFYLNHPKVFTLTERGHKTLLQERRARVQGFKRGISESLLTHELTVNGVGLILSQLLCLKVRSEFELATQWAQKDRRKSPTRYVTPDIWIMPGSVLPEDPVTVEIELTQKAEARYKKLWEHYVRVLPYGTLVLYLTSWPGGVKCILELTSKYGAQGGGYLVYVASLQSFQETGGRCIFTNHAHYDPRYLRLAPPRPAAPAPAIQPAAIAPPASSPVPGAPQA